MNQMILNFIIFRSDLRIATAGSKYGNLEIILLRKERSQFLPHYRAEKGFKGYRCESGIAIFELEFT